MSGNGPLVECSGVARTFGRGPTALVAVHDIECRVPAGARLALVGPSGSGKSTLLHLMAGLDLPTMGTVTWPALGERSQLRPGKVAVIFQSSSLVPFLDVTENVTLPLVLGGMEPLAARDLARAALGRLDLQAISDKLPDEISGGQAQRVAVARALAGRHQLILADEPTGQLDHSAGMAVLGALLEAAGDLGAALVVSTHDRTAAALLDEEWRMVDGRLTNEVA
jgi:ABC-type lipoprotein export system ATPase subunit